MKFRVRFKMANAAIDKAISYCHICNNPLFTHADIVYMTKKSDDSKYKTQYTMCHLCAVKSKKEFEMST